MSDIDFEDRFLGFLDSAIRQQKRMADRAMVQCIVLRLMMVVASASLPALTTIENRAWSTVAAILIAILTGLDTQFRWGEEWRHFRSTQLTLERIRRDYEYRKDALRSGRSIGNITTNADNFDKLVTEVEELLRDVLQISSHRVAAILRASRMRQLVPNHRDYAPALVAVAGERPSMRFPRILRVNIPNPSTRRTFARADEEFLTGARALAGSTPAR